jgi:hypothetical protein
MSCNVSLISVNTEHSLEVYGPFPGNDDVFKSAKYCQEISEIFFKKSVKNPQEVSEIISRNQWNILKQDVQQYRGNTLDLHGTPLYVSDYAVFVMSCNHENVSLTMNCLNEFVLAHMGVLAVYKPY